MIARHENNLEKIDIWSALAAPLPAGVISWRQDGRTVNRDGRFLARFVAYIEANTVRERLDRVVPGEWDKTLELLPPIAVLDDDANQGACNFKCRLSILGVIREDVGTGKDYKQAATDAFKRAAVRFGIGHELYAYEQNWVHMDGDGKFARPVEDPGVAYARRYGRPRAAIGGGEEAARPTTGATTGNGASTTDSREPSNGAASSASSNGGAPDTMRTTDEPCCPKCGGRVWDNRITKRNPKAPDFKCRDRSCDGVIWPPKGEKADKADKADKAEKAEPTDRADADESEEIPF